MQEKIDMMEKLHKDIQKQQKEEKEQRIESMTKMKRLIEEQAEATRKANE